MVENLDCDSDDSYLFPLELWKSSGFPNLSEHDVFQYCVAKHSKSTGLQLCAYKAIRDAEQYVSCGWLTLKDRKSILSAIMNILPLATTRLSANGDLLVHAQDLSPPDLLLQQSQLGDVEIREDSEEEIVSELNHLGVTKALRLRKRIDDTHVATDAVILWFSCAPPSKVQIANEFFGTHDLRHTAPRCHQQKRCRTCAKPHVQNDIDTCLASKCCRNCNSDRHTSDDWSCPACHIKQRILNFAQAENLSFHQAKDVLAKKKHLQDPEPITSWSTQLLPSAQCASPINASPPDPTDPQIEALQLEVLKLQSKVNSLKIKAVCELKTYLDSIVPAMIRLTPNISYIEEICRIVRQQQESTTISPALLSTDASDSNEHWNANGLKGHKREVFLQQLATINPQIVILSETHWNNLHVIFMTRKMRSYIIGHQNRPDGFGGVAIHLKKHLSFSLVPTVQFTNNIQATLTTVIS
ncbi:hypothetical protein OUZ56_029962 [Daphnia magna]|uniref:Uncharacterized protein n=1 Tax=Daphnia magna TaxID=35525 RepID=A0ABR0B8E9_9CRUS|nr:hypothetical protein OUZ56_029962 [Daphnia magna]